MMNDTLDTQKVSIQNTEEEEFKELPEEIQNIRRIWNTREVIDFPRLGGG